MLPKTIDPIKLAKYDAALQGELPLKNFPRLQEMKDQANQIARVSLRIETMSRVIVIRGEIQATLHLICQRCNRLMEYAIQHTFVLTPVSSDMAIKKLPDDYEPIMMHNDLISVVDMIEDEILLALPMVPKHEMC